MRKSLLAFFLMLSSCEIPQPSLSKPPTQVKPEYHSVSLAEDMLYPTVLVSSGESSGSGVIIKEKYVLTAKHCVKDVDNITIWMIRGLIKQDFTASIITMCSGNRDVDDWAILKINISVPPFLPMSDNNLCKSGLKIYSAKLPKNIAHLQCEPFDGVVAIGYPLGIRFPVITEGTLGQGTNLGGSHSSPIMYGNSGGPVFLKDSHELIGLNVQVLTLNTGIISIPVSHCVLFVPLSEMATAIDQLK